jgi:hypothetical protein
MRLYRLRGIRVPGSEKSVSVPGSYLVELINRSTPCQASSITVPTAVELPEICTPASCTSIGSKGCLASCAKIRHVVVRGHCGAKVLKEVAPPESVESFLHYRSYWDNTALTDLPAYVCFLLQSIDLRIIVTRRQAPK